jgi:hypothetical protein
MVTAGAEDLDEVFSGRARGRVPGLPTVLFAHVRMTHAGRLRT